MITGTLEIKKEKKNRNSNGNPTQPHWGERASAIRLAGPGWSTFDSSRFRLMTQQRQTSQSGFINLYLGSGSLPIFMRLHFPVVVHPEKFVEIRPQLL